MELYHLKKYIDDLLHQAVGPVGPINPEAPCGPTARFNNSSYRITHNFIKFI